MVDGESRPSSCACGGTLAQHRLALLSSWRDPQAQEPLLHRRDTPILPLRRERLRRNVEQVSPWFGVREPAHVRDRSNHAHLEGDRMVLSTLVLKDRKKPEQCWLPHGMPSDDRAFACASRVFPTASQIKAPYKLRHYQFIRSLKRKGFKEEIVIKIGLYDLVTSTTLESNKSQG